jgi:hypothetical protein
MVLVQGKQLPTFFDREIELPCALNKAKLLTASVIVKPVARGGSAGCQNQSNFVIVTNGLYRQIGSL